MKLTVDTSQLRSIAKEFSNKPRLIQRERRNLLKVIGKDTQEDLQAILPNRTGKLIASVRTKLNKSEEVSIYSDSKYVKFLEDGTNARMILPKKAKALHWDSKFSKGHMIKGIKAGKYFEKVFNKKQKQLKKYGLSLLLNITKTK